MQLTPGDLGLQTPPTAEAALVRTTDPSTPHCSYVNKKLKSVMLEQTDISVLPFRD